MRKTCGVIGLLTMLAACGDPLAGITRISQVDLVETDPSAQALPSEQEIAREGFFNTAAARSADGALLTVTPSENSQIAVDPVVAAPPPRTGLLGLLRRAVPAAQPVGGVEDTLSQDAFAAAKSAENTPAAEQTTLASLSPSVEPMPALEPAPIPEKRGLFARLTNSQPAKAGKAKSQSNLLEVDYGVQVPYGVIARSCAAKRQPLGRKVDAALASGYQLFDSSPNAAGPRTFYITGFDDGCPRQLTAAHVLLAEPSYYEQLHYGPSGQHLAFGDTDRAYEKVKGRVCGVGKGKPCGAKINQMEREAVFVNAYERLDDNKRWSEQLIHDGQVLATSMKTSG